MSDFSERTKILENVETTEQTFAQKRRAMNKNRAQSVLALVEDSIAEAKKLEDEGKEVDSQAVMDDLVKMVTGMIDEALAEFETPDALEFDRSVIPPAGSVLVENANVILKLISEEDHDMFMELAYETSVAKSAFKDEVFRESLWGDFTDDKAIVTAIFDKNTREFVGYCSIKDTNKKDWEIAIEEHGFYRNKGYGYNALTLFTKKLTELTGHRFYRARIDIDNVASQSLFKKIGAYPDGISEFLLHGKMLEEFQKENIDKIDDNIRKVADEFCTDPEDLIGHVLEYRIDMQR